MRLSILFLLPALLCCTSKKDDDMQTVVATEDTVTYASTVPEKELEEASIKENSLSKEFEEETAVDEDCIFDSDYRTATAAWLADKGIHDFTWDDINKRAVVAVQQDTFYATIGGCTHFGITAEQEFRLNETPLRDSAYWINHALRMTRLFDFDFYTREIEKGNVTFEDNGPSEVWFVFGDDDSEDNLIYNGIQVKEVDPHKIVSVSQYFN